MATKIFVNLPVQDLNKSKEFFNQIGYSFNDQFSDETTACMVVSEDIYVMLLTHAKFKQFTPKQVADASKTSEVLTCLSADSKAQVDTLVEKALNAGATEVRDPQDYGFMYGRSFNDLDGHIWEIMWMDPSAVK
ncbi:VOC family protein [Rapidithrix thailandica]|uniref:VOC family protein n=1 Tax=Rapidithrix thailandica TaxID=413964 RepID=A0AAW9SFN6_9BACT